jgi:hypothetical protein
MDAGNVMKNCKRKRNGGPMKPKKIAKQVNEEREIEKMQQADFEHSYYETRLDHVPDVVEGLGEDYLA